MRRLLAMCVMTGVCAGAGGVVAGPGAASGWADGEGGGRGASMCGAVLNETSGQTFASIQDAIDAAAVGESIVADASSFGLMCGPTIDFVGKALTVRSTSFIEREAGTLTVTADGAVLRAASGGARFFGGVVAPDGGVSEIDAGVTELRGGLDIGVGSVLRGTGDVVLGPDLRDGFERRFVSTSTPAGEVGGADLDGDGDADLKVGGVWYRNDGQAGVGGSVVFGGPFAAPQGVPAGDVNGDGLVDTIGLDRVCLNAANANDLCGVLVPHDFVGSQGQPLGGFESVRVWAADFDGDGDRDVLVTSLRDGLFAQAAVSENLGGAVPAFVTTVIGLSPTGDGSVDSAVGDFDGDGGVDFAVSLGGLAGSSVGRIVLFTLVPGPGLSFSGAPVFGDVGPRDGALAGADIDGDGVRDLVWVTGGLTVTRLGGFGGVVDAVSTGGVAGARAWGGDVDGVGGEDVFVRRVDGTLNALVAWSDASGFGSIDVLGGVAAAAPADVELDGDDDVFVVDGIGVGYAENGVPGERVLLSAGSALRGLGALFVEEADVTLGSGFTLGGGAALGVTRRGVVRGAGVLESPLVSVGGTLAPASGGALTVAGDLAMDFDGGASGVSLGTIEVDLGSGGFGTPVVVTQSASLGGALVVRADAGFDPPVGAVFDVLSASAVTGVFDAVFLPALDGKLFVVEYPTGLGGTVRLRVESLDGGLSFDPANGAQGMGVASAATLADVNGDGFVDLLTAVPAFDTGQPVNGSVSIFYNDQSDPTGAWQGFANVSMVQQVTTGVGVNPSAIGVSDLDGDGNADIVVANRGLIGDGEPDTLSVLINAPAPVRGVGGGRVSDPFGVGDAVPVGTEDEPTDLALVDLDGDTFEDIVVINAGASDSLSIFWNNGPTRGGPGRSSGWSGVSSEPATQGLPLPEKPTSVRPGEFSDPGEPDLVVASANAGVVTPIENDGARSVTLLPPIAVGDGPVELAVGDFDGDGLDDVASVDEAGNSVSVITNETGVGRASLSFGPAVSLPVSAVDSSPGSIAVGDFDVDGDPDVAIVADGDGGVGRVVKLLRNDGAVGGAGFAPAVELVVPGTPVFVRAGDVDGDSVADLVTVGTTGIPAARGVRGGDQRVSVFLSEAAPCPGDATGDGLVGPADLFLVLAHFGDGTATGPAEGDVDGVPGVGPGDLFLVLANFGGSC